MVILHFQSIESIFGGTELDIKIDTTSKSVQTIKLEIDLSEIEGHDVNTGLEIESAKDRSFERDVIDSVESFMNDFVAILIDSIERCL